MSRLIKRGYDADAIHWVVTRGYSIAAAPAGGTGHVKRVGLRRGLSAGSRRGLSTGTRRGLRTGVN